MGQNVKLITELAIHNISRKILIFFYQNASGNKHLKDNETCYCYDIYNLQNSVYKYS